MVLEKKGVLGVSPGALEVLQVLRDGRPRTRTGVAEKLGVARSTVGLRMDELIDVGLLRIEDEPVYSGGRPSTRVVLAHTQRVVLGIDIGATHFVVAVMDLRGQAVSYERRTIEAGGAPERILTEVLAASDRLLTKAGWDRTRVAVIGVGLAAPIEHATGRPINPPIMPLWDGFDTASWFAPHFAAPVLVEKDVNLMALGERFSRWPTVRNMIFAKISTGIGAGLILNGRLHRGEQGTAGDIGHVRLSRGGDIPCHCGNRGCLEAMASGPSLARKLREDGLDVTSSLDIVTLIKAGDLEAIQAVRQAGRDLGEVLASSVSLINPAVIVIGGSLSAAGEHLITGVKEVVYARAMPLATAKLNIVQADPLAGAGVIGAGVLAIGHVLGEDA